MQSNGEESGRRSKCCYRPACNCKSADSCSKGTYEFTVPYSTLCLIPGETQFDTKPTGPYTIVASNVSKTIDISEKDVLDGNTITLNLV